MLSGGSDPAGRSTDATGWRAWTTLLLAVGLLAPIVVVPGVFFPYVVPRTILFRVAVELACAGFVLRLLLGKARVELRGEYVLGALTAFLLAITISALFSPARNHSLFGDFERMGGVWAWLHFVLFFLVLRTLEEKHIAALLYAALGVSVVASVHAILGHSFGVGAGISIVGNQGIFAGYLLLALPVALWLVITDQKYRRWFLAAAAIDLAALVMTENRSSILGLAAGGVTGAVLFALGARGRGRRWLPLLIVASGIASIIGIVAMNRAGDDGRARVALPGVLRRMSATDLNGSDASRTIQWSAAIAGFRDRPILGYGSENHHLVWSAHFDPRSERFSTSVFDRAHNQFLEILATTGLVGAISFLALWIAIGYSLYRAFSEGRLSIGEASLLGGANVAYATYLIFWFVDINAAIVWLLLAAVIASRWNPRGVARPAERLVSRRYAVGGVLVAASILVLVLYRHAYLPVRAGIALGTLDSYRGDRDRGMDAVVAIARSRAPQTSHTGQVLAQFIDSLSGRGELDVRATGLPGEEIDLVFRTGIAAFDDELARDPLNDRLHGQAAALLIKAYDYYGSEKFLTRSITLLKRASDLNPRRAHHRRMLATAYARYEGSRGAKEPGPRVSP